MADSESDGLLSSNGGLCNGDGNGLLSSEEGNRSEVRSKVIGRSRLRGEEKDVADSSSEGLQRSEQHEALDRETKTPRPIAESFKNDGSQWAVEPNVGRVADGIPKRVDRLKALGNAIIPQIIYQIGVAIAKEHNK
jgi:DNA (cytosine-5)-methyltransferase 1